MLDLNLSRSHLAEVRRSLAQLAPEQRALMFERARRRRCRWSWPIRSCEWA